MATQTRNLVAIGKVWGFLKYHHPRIAAGKIDWDGQLIQLIEDAPSIRSKQALSARLLSLVNELGSVAACRSCSSADSTDFTQNLDLSWLTDSSLFSLPLRQQLTYLAANRNQRKNRYAHWNSFRNRLDFPERAYEAMALPNASYRLLGLFRYWNIIEYFHPAKYTFTRDWDQVLTAFIPTFQQATDTLRYQNALQQLISTIHDGHAELSIPTAYRITPKHSVLWPSFEWRLVGDTLLVLQSFNDSLSRLDDIRRGDRLIQVDGQSISDIIDQHAPNFSASNRSTLAHYLQRGLLVGTNPSIEVELIRDGQRLRRVAHRYVFNQFGYQPQSLFQANVVPPTIGYVDLSTLRVSDVKRVMKQYRNHRGIIFDMRGYPKGTFQRLGDYLNPEPRGFARYTEPDLLRPGLFKWTKIRYVGRKNADYYRGKVAILCNSFTQSAAESTCMALRTAPRAKIIGTQSAGANGDVSYVRFPGGYQTRFSGRGVYTMDGQLVLGPGVPIDIVAKPSSDDVLTGTDRALQTAIDWIGR
ncbi:hypothetical protein GCM10028817_07430 [Spirosoma pomorum]